MDRNIEWTYIYWFFKYMNTKPTELGIECCKGYLLDYYESYFKKDRKDERSIKAHLLNRLKGDNLITEQQYNKKIEDEKKEIAINIIKVIK